MHSLISWTTRTCFVLHTDTNSATVACSVSIDVSVWRAAAKRALSTAATATVCTPGCSVARTLSRWVWFLASSSRLFLACSAESVYCPVRTLTSIYTQCYNVSWGSYNNMIKDSELNNVKYIVISKHYTIYASKSMLNNMNQLKEIFLSVPKPEGIIIMK